jgi:AraC-like DNA-binding protein
MANNSFSVQLGKERLWIRMEPARYIGRHTWQVRRHCHGNYELQILLNGRCRVSVEDRVLSLRTGDGILIAPGEYHYPNSVEGDILRFSLAFTPETPLLQQALLQVLSKSITLSIPDKLLQLCADIFQEYAAGNLFKNEIMQSMLSQLIIHLLRQLNLEGIPSDPPDSLSEIQFIITIDDFFENNFAEPAGEELLAKELNLSRRQLDRVLQKYYGMGYRQKLIRARMDHAAWLLRTTDWHISRVAAIVGYTSDSAFFQVFRSHFGMTPNRYRKLTPKE